LDQVLGQQFPLEDITLLRLGLVALYLLGVTVLTAYWVIIQQSINHHQYKLDQVLGQQFPLDFHTLLLLGLEVLYLLGVSLETAD
jgi:hypothetical protein